MKKIFIVLSLAILIFSCGKKKAEKPVIETKKTEEAEPVKPVKVENSKPKIKVDNDSVIVDEHVVSDDEFFDDFFGD